MTQLLYQGVEGEFDATGKLHCNENFWAHPV